MQEFIQNPRTGRKIMIGGPVYKQLLKAGVDVANRQAHPVVESKAVRPYKTTRGGPSEDRLTSSLELAIHAPTAPGVARSGRGSATRGWGARAPRRGRPRNALHEACGDACFLGENKGFPICPGCETYPGECQCEIDCAGVNAAFVRAQQWNYPDVASAAQRLLREKCGRNPKARKTF